MYTHIVKSKNTRTYVQKRIEVLISDQHQMWSGGRLLFTYHTTINAAASTVPGIVQRIIITATNLI